MQSPTIAVFTKNRTNPAYAGFVRFLVNTAMVGDCMTGVTRS